MAVIVIVTTVRLFVMEAGVPVVFDGPVALGGSPPLHGPVVPERLFPAGVAMVMVALGDPVMLAVPIVVARIVVMPVVIVPVGEQAAIRTRANGGGGPRIAPARLGNARRGAGIPALRHRRGGARRDESEQANEHHPGHTAFHGHGNLPSNKAEMATERPGRHGPAQAKRSMARDIRPRAGTRVLFPPVRHAGRRRRGPMARADKAMPARAGIGRLGGVGAPLRDGCGRFRRPGAQARSIPRLTASFTSPLAFWALPRDS